MYFWNHFGRSLQLTSTSSDNPRRCPHIFFIAKALSPGLNHLFRAILRINIVGALRLNRLLPRDTHGLSLCTSIEHPIAIYAMFTLRMNVTLSILAKRILSVLNNSKINSNGIFFVLGVRKSTPAMSPCSESSRYFRLYALISDE
jgi:hypothetical protein